jgi:hypothetical protein
MSANRSIERSRRLYQFLLGLYPSEHRRAYGPAMAQLFGDQCRSAHHQNGWRGLLALWMRTLVDLGKSALVEHFASPQAQTAFFQATPGSPLPWKGVLLVLIPGLVIFVSQLGQLAGNGWFLSTLAWAGYAFIVPVLLVWWRARRFPVWGLVPLGLLLQHLAGRNWFFNTTIWAGYGLVMALLLARSRVRKFPVWGLVLIGLLLPQMVWFWPDIRAGLSAWLVGNPLRALFQPLADFIPASRSLLALLINATVLSVLGWRAVRGHESSGATRRWFGVYALLLFAKLAIEVVAILWTVLKYIPSDLRFIGKIIGTAFNYKLPAILDQFSSDAYVAVAFLVLVFLSGFLARRHGALAFLLPLGYLLPTIVYGATITGPGDPYFPLVGGMVFVYRLSIAIVAPVWIARSVSRKQQAWAVTIPIVIALAAQIVLPIATRSVFTPPEYILRPILDGLMILAGSALALTLYRSTSPEVPGGIVPQAATPQLSPE